MMSTVGKEAKKTHSPQLQNVHNHFENQIDNIY